jgi:hypothetical protein
MTDLYSLLLVFKNSPHNLRFHFKSEASIKAAYEAMKLPPLMRIEETETGTSIERAADHVEIEDDYGNRATVDRSQVMCAVSTWVNEDLNAQMEAGLLQAHMQAKAQRRAAADPMLKQAQVVQAPNNFRQ